MNTSFTLFRLQAQDTLRMKMNARLKEIDRIIAADEEVRQAKAKLVEAQGINQSAESVLKGLADQVKEKKLKRDLTQSNLFSGKVRNPKELQDLQAETQALARTIAKLEDEQLQAMMAHEETTAALHAAEKELQQVLDRKASQNSLLLGEKHKIESEIPQVDAQRQALIEQLDKETFMIYRTLLKSKAGRAVAEVNDDTCGACGVTVPPADIQAAKSPNVIAYCKNCGRILYKP
jgi:predicted  nucleic acid-binding Zn-ribbon protein